MRTRDSVELDEQRISRSGQQFPPYVRFDVFMRSWVWKQGEHITTIGPTGSGKTVLNRQLLRRRDFTVVLGVKRRDRELYGPFQRDGYELVRSFDPYVPDDEEHRRLLFVPLSDHHGEEGNREKGRKFRAALHSILEAGRWCVYADDVQYMVDALRLGPEFKEIWQVGRSEDISLVASSQEPVDIPVSAYSSASHLFLFKNPDLYRAKRMAELTGLNREVTQNTILRLPDHEFLYVNKSTGLMIRSSAPRPR